MSDLVTIIPFLLAVFAVGLSGALFMPGEWYKMLNKPAWTPPDWLFGPAWALLYIMIAVSGWLVWGKTGLSWTLGIWSANLVFNAAWSWLMFGRHRIDLALADASAMFITILVFIYAAWPISPSAAMLFLPYLAWVAFAWALNLSILQRNTRFATRANH